MNDDARFEDGREAPLNLGALDAEDLRVISALAQDAVFPAAEISWRARARRFAILLNRFRWEDDAQGRHGPERVQAVLSFDNVLNVASQGVDPRDTGTILSLLAIDHEATSEGAERITLTLAGDGAIRLEIEALEARLRDVTRPYRAPSRRAPGHVD